MDNEKKTDVEDAPKTEKKFCNCGDLRTFFIALLTSAIVVAGYHIARVTFRQYLQCVRGQQIRVTKGGACRCRQRNFRMPPRDGMPGEPGRPRFDKPGFPGKRGRFGKPMPPKDNVGPAPKPAPEAKPAAPKAPAPAPAEKPAAK